MNKFSKSVISISLATVFTIATPLTTYTTVAHANESTAPVMDKQEQTNLGSENIMAVSWYQNSAEAKALYLQGYNTVSYTHLTLPTNTVTCRSRWSPYH